MLVSDVTVVRDTAVVPFHNAPVKLVEVADSPPVPVTAVGAVTAAEVEQAALAVAKLVETIGPGFYAVADYRWVENVEPPAALHIGHIMDSFAKANVGLVIRIVPTPQP